MSSQSRVNCLEFFGKYLSGILVHSNSLFKQIQRIILFYFTFYTTLLITLTTLKMSMYNPVMFSENLSSTVIHASTFLQKYKDLFKWANSEDILEVGCANGRITKEILYPFVEKYVRRLIAADISDLAVKNANETNDNPKISFHIMDITNAEECDKYLEQFQHIFAFYLFHVVKNSELWSKNLYKMLKPTGQMFTSIIASSPNFFNDCLAEQRSDKSKPWFKYIKNLPTLFVDYGDNPIETISGILKNVGFVVDRIDIQPANSCFKTIDAARNTWVGGNPFIKHIPEELHQEYIEDFVGKVLKYARIENGMYTTTFDIVTVLVTKP